MELKATAQITRKSIIRAVLMYSLIKGRLVIASLKFSHRNALGKITGGVALLSATVLKLVRIIQMKGNTMMRAAAMSTT